MDTQHAASADVQVEHILRFSGTCLIIEAKITALQNPANGDALVIQHLLTHVCRLGTQ
jgi:hypothetical protein